MKHKDLYYRFGVRNSGNITTPTVVKKSDFKFPEDSIWFWSSRLNIPSTPKEDVGLLTNNADTKIVVFANYIFPRGKSKQKYKTKDIEKELKPLTSSKIVIDQKLLRLERPNTLLLFNFGCMNWANRFVPYKGFTVDRFQDRWRTLVETLRHRNTPSKRHRYITMDIPKMNRSSLEALERATNMTSSGIERLMNEEDLLPLLELWKMLTPSQRENSVFDVLSDEEMINTTILFQHNSGITMFNLYEIVGMVSEYEMDSNFSMQDKTARKVLFLYLLKVKNALVQPSAMIENDHTPIKATEGTLEGDISFSDVKGNVDKIIDDEVNSSEMIEDIEMDLDDVVEEVTVEKKEMTLEDVHKLESTPEHFLDIAIRDGKVSINEANRIREQIAEQKAMKLKESYTLTDEEIQVINMDESLPDSPVIFDKELLKTSVDRIDETYMKSVYRKDIKSVIYGLQDSGIMIESYEVKDVKNISGEFEEHIIEFKPIGGAKSTQTIRMAKVNEDGSIKTNNNYYLLIRQKVDLPFSKIKPTQVALSSNVGKLLVTKAKFAKNNRARYINKLLNKHLDEGTNDIRLVINSATNIRDAKLPMEWYELARYCKTVVTDKYEFMFLYRLRNSILQDTKYKLEEVEKHGHLIGKDNKGNPLLMRKDGIIVMFDGKKVTELGKLTDLLQLDMSRAPTEFSSLAIGKDALPVGLVLSYYLGLSNLLNVLKTKYRTIEAGKRIPVEERRDTDMIIKFADKTLIISEPTPLQSMILEGLVSLNKITPSIPYREFDSETTTPFVLMGVKTRTINELKANKTLFIDPITKTVLKEMNEPTNLPSLLIRASEELLTDDVTHPNDGNHQHIRGYERIPGIMAKTLASAVKEQMSDSQYGKASVKINRFETWGAIANDSTLMMRDRLNPIANLKQRHDVTQTGIGGRNMDTMTVPTREYHKTDVGIISDVTPDSSKAGVNVALSANPQFKNIRGMRSLEKVDNLNPASVFSISSNLAPLGRQDAPKRLNFSDVQNKHTIGLKNYMIIPIRTGYESILPLRMGEDFCVTAVEEGKVISVSSSKITIEYKTKGKKDYKIKTWFTQEESGTCHKHELITHLKKGDVFQIGDGIVYDSLFFGLDMLVKGKVALKNGLIIKTVYSETYSTYEDGTEFTSAMKDVLNTKSIKIKTVRLNLTDKILDILEDGADVDINTSLLQFGQDDGYESEALNKESIDTLKDVKNNSPKAGYKGKLIDTKIYYYGNEMSRSMKKIVDRNNERVTKEFGEPMTGQVDNTFSDSGIPIKEGEIIIKMYIETETTSAFGDKMIFWNQLKCTISNISTQKVTYSGGEVQAFFSAASAEARIVNSPDALGTMTTILMKISANARKVYRG